MTTRTDFAGIMLLVPGELIPPLAFASTLFGAGAAVTFAAARAGAISVGLVSALWLGLNVAFASQVVPDLDAAFAVVGIGTAVSVAAGLL